MFPGKDNADIAKEAVSFFNQISKEYAGVDKPPVMPQDLFIPWHEIAAALKKIRKPNSTVDGDIPPKLLNNDICDIISEPIHYLYSQILEKFEWPMLWKQETVTDPKKDKPWQPWGAPQSVMHSSLIEAAWIIPTQWTEKTCQTFPDPIRGNKRKRGRSLSYRHVAWHLISPGRPPCRCCPCINRFWKGIQQDEPPTLHYCPLLKGSPWPPCRNGSGFSFSTENEGQGPGSHVGTKERPWRIASGTNLS